MPICPGSGLRPVRARSSGDRAHLHQPGTAAGVARAQFVYDVAGRYVTADDDEAPPEAPESLN